VPDYNQNNGYKVEQVGSGTYHFTSNHFDMPNMQSKP
jgi:hypothetical protein